MSGNRLKQGRAIFLAAIMIISMSAVGFAGSAAAAVDSIDSASAEDVDVAGDTATQTLTLSSVDNDDTTETITVDLGSNIITDAEVTADGGHEASVTTDFSDPQSAFDIELADNNVSSDDIEVDITHDVSGQSSSDSTDALSYTVGVTDGNQGDLTSTFTFVDTSEPVQLFDSEDNVIFTDDNIGDALSEASADQTIEVDANGGPYEEQVTVDKDVTLESVNGQATITTQTTNNNGGAGVPTVKITSDGAEIYGFEIISQGDDESSLFSQSLQTEDVSDIHIENNLLSATNLDNDDAPERQGGLLVQAGSTGVSNITIQDNVVDGSGAGIYTDADGQDIDELTVDGNDVTNVRADAEFALSTRNDGTIGTVNGESEINAQIQAVVNNNPGIDTTAPIGVSPDPDTVVGGQETTVDVSLSGVADDASVNYALTTGSNGDNIQQTGSTDAGQTTVSLTSSFNSGENYFFNVSRTSSAVDLNTPSNVGGSAEITAEVRNVTQDVTVDGNAVYNQTVTINGTLVDVNGDPVEGNSMELVNPDENPQAISTTNGDGDFEFTNVDLTDGGDWKINDTTTGGDADTVETIEVAPADATVSVEAAGNNLRNFEETYTINATSETGAALADFSNAESPGNNVINVTGPFSDYSISEGTEQASGDDGEGNTTWIRVDPSTDGGDGVVITATPTLETEEVSTQLEVYNGSDWTEGYEADEDWAGTGADAPDLVGSDSIATQDSDADLLVSVPADNIKVNGPADTDDPVSFDVEVVGGDNNPPADSNSLVNATVTISAPDIGIEEESIFIDGGDEGETGPSVTFDSLNPEQAGEVSIDVTANKSDGTEVTDSQTLTVVGDNYNNLSPTQPTNDDSRQDVSLQVTNADGTPLNNRIVELTGVTFNVSSPETGNAYETSNTLAINGPEGKVFVDGYDSDDSGTAVQDIGSVNNGEYTAENVSFDTTGDINLEVANSAYDDSRVDEAAAISVTGVEAYEVSSNRSTALAGADEPHTLTITEDGAAVNGSALNDFTVDVTNGDTTTEIASPTVVDTNDDNTEDALEINAAATNASAPLNISVTDDSSSTGQTTLDVAAPAVTAAVNDREGDILTEGLNSTVDYTVEDPRDGSAFADGTVTVEAVNATFEVDNDQDGTAEATLSDGDEYDITLDEDGQNTSYISVQELADDADSPALLHNARTADASIGAGDVELPVGSPSIFLFENGERADVPATVEPNSEVDYTFEVVDANDRNLPLDGVGFSATGAGLTEATTLDEGFASVSGEVDSGTIDLVIIDDVGPVNVGSIDALDTADLNLTADAESVEQNGSIEFELTRSDFTSETSGQLNITDASGEEVTTTPIDGIESVTFDTDTYEPGEYTVEATKESTSSTAFNASSVDVTVEAADEPGDTGSLTFNDQTLGADGAVTVEDVSTGQNSTVVVTYANGSNEEVVAGVSAANNLAGENVSVDIEDTGGFPGDHTAWVFNTSDLPSDLGIGANATPVAGAALDSETATISEATGDTGSLTFNDQTLGADGAVTVEDVATGQESTVVVTYQNDSENVVAGTATADNLAGENVSVEIEDTGGFPGDHTAWVFNTSDVEGVAIGDDATPVADQALDSETAFISQAETGDVPDELNATATNAVVASAGVDDYTQLSTLDTLDAYASFLEDGTVGGTQLEGSLPILDLYAYQLENPDEFGN
ncbi:hypothetical protein HKK80_11285 [Halonotius sp. F2-221B]|uniref:surface glycoprotein n=1 Tax=Halonotius sp. F2-221B TaxID=2731620 RepID=UPI00398B26ED